MAQNALSRAVKIESNTEWNLKELDETLGNAKTLRSPDPISSLVKRRVAFHDRSQITSLLLEDSPCRLVSAF